MGIASDDAVALEASQQVLKTHELLALILDQVPLECKSRLCRVSTAWHDLLSKSRQVDPFPESLGLDRTDVCAGIPHYTSEINFRINPAVEQDFGGELEQGAEEDTAWHDEHGVAVQLCPQLGEEEMVARQDQFLTDPPITTISMNLLYSSMSVTFRDKGGIRIRDFMSVYRAMNAQVNVSERGFDGKSITPAGWLALCKDGKVFEPCPRFP